MNEKIQKIIKENIDLIDKGDFDSIYQELRAASDNIYISMFTEAMLKAGIDPLQYLTYVPATYLSGSDIESIGIPDNIISINQFAFFRCTKLKEVILSDNLKHIENYVFSKTAIEHIHIPNQVQSIKVGAFLECSQLKDFSMPDSLKYLGARALSRCNNLTNIRFSNSLEYIPEALLSYDTAITKLDIPNNVKYIEKYAFLKCSSLRDLSVSENISADMLRQAGVDMTKVHIIWN